VPIDEALPKNPINPYGESKLAFEKSLRCMATSTDCVSYASLFQPAGASETPGNNIGSETI